MKNELTLRVLVVNLNNKEYTKDCINYLLTQDYNDFKITVIDQNSSELGTKESFNQFTDDRLEIIYNNENKPLNSVWSSFAKENNEDILCFLNNDVIIPKNFIGDIINVFNREPNVGVVVHSTNHESFCTILDTTEYEVVEKNKFMQGWDYSIRRELFNEIPKELKTYCGDDYTFQNVYNNGHDVAYLTSSPMLHYEGQSKKFMKTSGVEDIYTYIRLGFPHHLKINPKFSKIKPSENFIKNFKI
jgi:glycosyltransferase involved in cell wall biosynthesis